MSAADIENLPISEQERKEIFKKLDDCDLVAQDLVQQGAIHALSTLLKAGVNEMNAAEMLNGLRINAGLIRAEFERRGHEPIFSKDQTNFN